MSESVRSIIVKIEVDTNKRTRRAALVMEDEESIAAFETRVREALTELTEVS